jgi:predicted nuclease of predicted toxin-antitoxin system
VRFLIDADLPRSTRDLMQRYGHEAIDVREIGLGAAKDFEIAAYAQAQRVCLITGDFDFADIRNYPPEAYAGIVILELPRNATATFILRLIEDFLQQGEVLSKLEGRLAIVEPGRVRLRPS